MRVILLTRSVNKICGLISVLFFYCTTKIGRGAFANCPNVLCTTKQLITTIDQQVSELT